MLGNVHAACSTIILPERAKFKNVCSSNALLTSVLQLKHPMTRGKLCQTTVMLTFTYSCWNSSRLRRPVGQSFRKPLYHCFSSCSLNSVLFTRSSSASGVSLLFCFPMVSLQETGQGTMNGSTPV